MRFKTYFGIFLMLSVLISLNKIQAQDPAVTIGMTDDLEFNPKTVTIKAGETILWKNNSKLVHTVTFDPSKAIDKSHVKLPANVEPFGSGRISPGNNYSHTFETPGNYKYFCIPHEASGMIGEVIVEGSGESNKTGAANIGPQVQHISGHTH